MNILLPGTERELLQVTERGVDDLCPGGEAGQQGGLLCHQDSDHVSPAVKEYSTRLLTSELNISREIPEFNHKN